MNSSLAPITRLTCVALVLLALAGREVAAEWVHVTAGAGDFPVVAGGRAATVVTSSADAKVVQIAGAALVRDIELVSGVRPEATTTPFEKGGPIILVGTLGRSPLIDWLVRDHQVEIGNLEGAWESFVIATVDHPWPNVPQALVIIGSDRRGTAFGVFELSEALGVSPWYWWADVAPTRRPELHVTAGTHRFGPPSVKYRGVFLNDEDWGLQPWAAKTFEPENGDIGPKTYARLFELMLRLKANTVWPAMHACTRAFNTFPENKEIADNYAIVMGSSHAEPMLRDNVGEWKDSPEQYNYVTNREGVRAYWEQRVRENGRYENIYTVGMRGVHDSGIQGAKTDADRIRILEQVFDDQRSLLARYARPPGTPRGTATDVTQIPQMFCAYKEVLGLYRQGLKVPEDVTIVWPDDNFGYIRNFASAGEQKRSGGFGVYYHLSYLGAPMAYLWLYTTPPALVAEEMTKAYAYGARNLWIANVGDLKPAEIGTEFFLRLAWDVREGRPGNSADFLRGWARREFGAAHADEIAAILGAFYQLNFQRRPEHLQWWLPKQAPRPSPFTRAETDARLAAFAALVQRVDAVEQRIEPARRDAFFELVAYPVRGSALANERYFNGELAALAAAESPERTAFGQRAVAADAALREQTRIYDEQIAGGKWRRFMNLEPADEQWKSFRLSPWKVPAFANPSATAGAPAGEVVLSVEAGAFRGDRAGTTSRWQVVKGLGRTGSAITVLPVIMPAVAADRVAADAPAAEYPFEAPAAGALRFTFYLVPTQPIAGGALRFAIGIDGGQPVPVELLVRDGSADWAQGVLNATRTVAASLEVPAGRHVLRVYGTEPGVVLDQIVASRGELPASYFAPPSTPAVPR